METLIAENLRFVDLSLEGILFLFFVGLVGGLVSGFIGSGGAFVLTPGMMSLGVPAPVAVASNMCHKFPKALVGAVKRYRYGQVDVKMGLILGLSAEVGVQAGIQVQKAVIEAWGEAGANLYVSLSYVAVLLTVGLFVLKDAVRTAGAGGVEQPSGLARRLQRIELWPMLDFPASNLRISFWFTAPVGLAAGFLAATIAVGGFAGVPGMMYIIGMTSVAATATELVLAFIMGLGGTLVWAWYGMVDIRLALIILAGSLFGVQLGAIGTTYVKAHVIKYVMALIMLIVAVSRVLAVPGYLAALDLLDWPEPLLADLKRVSFGVMCFSLVFAAAVILRAMFKKPPEPASEREAGTDAAPDRV